jgi:hypothetical protein
MSSLGQSLAGKPQNFPAVEPSKYYLDFQLKGRQAKLNEVLNDKITIEGKCKFRQLL